jgi:hypothetical protein
VANANNPFLTIHSREHAVLRVSFCSTEVVNTQTANVHTGRSQLQMTDPGLETKHYETGSKPDGSARGDFWKERP